MNSTENLIQLAKVMLIEGNSVDVISKKLHITYTQAVTITGFALSEMRENKKAIHSCNINDIRIMENKAYDLAVEIGSGNQSFEKRAKLNSLLMELEKTNI
jgi:hypothetical protein